MKTLLRVFFKLLYHQFAFGYDLVAASVSFNRWTDWVMSVVPFIEGNRILEMGHGPGHLQRILLSRGLTTTGIDESAQMGRLAKRNLTRIPKNSQHPIDYTQINLTRGIAQQLPFQSESFETIVATFPTEYIRDPETLSEVKRCLLTGGKMIVLPAALPKNPFLDRLFKVTHQSPIEAVATVQEKLREPFVEAGFKTEVRALDLSSGVLLVIIAQK